MDSLRRVALLIGLFAATLACSLGTSPAPPTPTAIPALPTVAPTDTPAAQPTAAATDTPAPTETVAPADTQAAGSGSLPFSNLANIAQHFNPVGQPVQDWNGIPIMPAAIAGQEYQGGQVYSFKASATIAQAVSFYEAKLPALGYQSFMAGPATGSAGTGSYAIHDSVLYYLNGSKMLLLYIASYDSDLSHVSVVMSTQ